MLNIIHCSLTDFKKAIVGKKVFVFGAGANTIFYYEEWALDKYYITIVDNNPKLYGKMWEHASEIPIVSKNTMIKDIDNRGIENCVLLIMPSFFSADIIEELDRETEINGLTTYVRCLIAEYYIPQKFSFTTGKTVIPKKIHYCWFGNNPIPDNMKRCIDSWHKYCPDYEIIQWNESNYDITKNDYMNEAYQCGKWGFVPDYARLDIIYQYGGIYLDTDIEIFRSFDDLLCDQSFFATVCEGRINIGAGFGAVCNNKLIKEMRDYYDDKHFIQEDETMNLAPCQHYQTPVFKSFGFKTTNCYQKIDGNAIYPMEVFCPIGTYSGFEYFTEKTHSAHYGYGSWCTEEELKGMERFKRMIRTRLNKSENS